MSIIKGNEDQCIYRSTGFSDGTIRFECPDNLECSDCLFFNTNLIQFFKENKE